MPMAMTIEMKVETNIENHSWAIKMAKHVMVMNRQLKSRLLAMIGCRLLCTNKIHSQKTARKKLKIKSISSEGEN
ncbi:WD-repeat protein, putative [Medicago truncatula]|uniref:WD-repeat protein, putative n=1 Tax=Medicago truncatula TaxID=3880 RepID=G7JLG4_MEDTR|nr:WD-repeat protein, putative [Medicago truncatula]